MIKEARFFLNKPKGSESTHIFLMFTCKDKTLKYSTGHKILPANWNTELQRASSDKTINNALNHLHSVVSKYQDKCEALGKFVIAKELIDELDEKTNNSGTTSSKSIFPFLEKIIKEAKEGKILTPKGDRYTPGSLINWGKTKDRLFEYNRNLQFDTITLDTYSDFISFCNRKKYSINYTGTLIKDIKRLMGIAYSKNYHSNLIYKHPDFKIISEESIQVYLNEEEIQKIYSYDFSYNKLLETVRDGFIINIYNGLRVSDVKKLRMVNFQNGKISSINKKTNKKVSIPVHPIVDEIIAKYDGKLPHQYHEAIVNRYIKDIVRLAGITDRIEIVKTIGGIKKHYHKEKWEMITNHSCRRSLVTNLLKYASTTDVQPVVGMSLKTLEKYNKRSADENADRLKNNPFFAKK